MAPPRLKVGVDLPPQHTSMAEYRDAWLRADALGVDSIWNWDHFFPLSGDPDGAHFEAWTTLAALGAQTTRAAVGCLVLSMSYRNPALLSAMAKTLDHLTGGRLILGLGAGWFERDYAEYGYDFGTAGGRLKNLERGIEIIKARWAADEPKPVRGTIPILVGGGGEKVTLRIVAQHADLWNGGDTPEEFRHKSAVLDDWCRKVGRDPAAIERTVTVGKSNFDKIDDFVAAGATHLIHQVGRGAPWDFAALEQLLAWRDRQNGG
jgi:probable F420-dependent oxidoreductase